MPLTINNIYEKFTDLYWPTINNYNGNIAGLTGSSILEKRFLSEYRASLKWILKHCGTLVPPKASSSALVIAQQFNIDLFRLQWKDQPRAEMIINGISGRNFFVHEHQFPVSDLFEEILNASDKDSVLKIFQKQSIVWITEEENSILPRNRRYLLNEYELANIKIENNPYGDLWMEGNFKIN
jgi:hypothetical protein